MINYKDETWDYLIILDAARYDVFKGVVKDTPFVGDLKMVKSGAMQTPDWYKLHWQNPPEDVVLISDNPQPFSQKASGNVAKHFSKAIKSWNTRILDPESALKMLERVKRPNERYLLHLIPPHLPYFGSRGVDFISKLGKNSLGVYKEVQEYGQKGNWDELKEYYKENMRVGLMAILNYLYLFEDGKLVITADHGELIGEGDAYAHHSFNKDLIDLLETVPWYAVDIQETLVEKRLVDLGY